MEEVIEVNLDEVVEYIADKMQKENLVMSHGLIAKILNYETEWMIQNGLAVDVE